MTLQSFDYVLIAMLALFGLGGVRRGLVSAGAELVALVLTILAAARWHPAFADLLVRSFEVAGGQANVAAFVLILVGGRLLYVVPGMVVDVISGALLDSSGFLRAVNHTLGVVPGLARGVIVLSLLALALVRLPLAEPVRTATNSTLAGHLAGIAESAVPTFGQAVERLPLDAGLLAVPTGDSSAGATRLDFPPGLATEVDVSAEDAMLRLVNRERANYGLPLLTMDERLRRVARSHSEEMFRLSYFAHESPVRGTPFDRIRAAAIPFAAAGENLAYAPNVELAHQGLMKSPEHRRNLLSPAYHRVGIGIIRAGSWGRMVTQNFAD